MHQIQKSVFTICMSNNALDNFLAGQNCDLEECVRKEAILNCSLETWSSMMCIIASGYVLQRTIRSHFPCNEDKRIQTVLNTSIKPEVLATARLAPTIGKLWTRSDQSSDHNCNHFAPLFIRQGNDYAAQSQQKQDKQIKISKLFKRQLELTNSSTKKGRSVNFSLGTNSCQTSSESKITISPSTPTTHILPSNEATILRQNIDSASNRPEQNPVSNNESIVENSIPKSISRTNEVVEKVVNTTPDNKYFTNTSGRSFARSF